MQKQIQVEKTEQEEKELSFEEICPEYTQIISNAGGFMNVGDNTKYESEDGAIRCLGEFNYCVVGEAHNAL